MKRTFKRRTILGLLGSGAAAAVGPIAIGWRRLIADAAGANERSDALAKPADFATPEPHPRGAEVVQAPPAEEIVLIGKVDKVLGPATFVGSSTRFAGVTVDVSGADPVYPKHHVPQERDDFAARGRWLGSVGGSTFQVEFVDYNIRRVRGHLSTGQVLDPEANYTIRDIGTGETWQLVVRPANVEHLTVHGSAPQPTEDSLTFGDGTAVDMIGYEARPNVIIITWVEAHP